MSLIDQEIQICEGVKKKLKNMGDGTYAEVVVTTIESFGQQSVSDLTTQTNDLLTTISTYVDQVESLLSTVGGNTSNLSTLLNQLGLNTDQVEAILTSVASKLDSANTVLGSLNTALSSIDGKTATLSGGKVPVVGPLTNAELTSAGLATNASLVAAKASIDSILAKIIAAPSTEAKQDTLISTLNSVKADLDIAIPLLQMAQAPEGWSQDATTGDLISFIRRLPDGTLKVSAITKTVANGIETYTPGAWL